MAKKWKKKNSSSPPRSCVFWCVLPEQGDLEYFETCPGGEPGLRERLKNVLQNDFVRMTYTELVDLVRKDAKEGKVGRQPHPLHQSRATNTLT